MHFTDIFIKRPVLATVVSLLIVLLGIKALGNLQVREYPKLEEALIEITTSYPGADAELVQGFLTNPIQKAVANVDGIDYVTSSSAQSISSIKIHLKLGYDANIALTDITTELAEVKNDLPKAAQEPIIRKGENRGTALMYISFSSKQMTDSQVTDYLTRVVQPKLSTVQGVGEAQILGDRTFAMRVWLNPVKMVAFHITPAEVSAALTQNNFQTAAGDIKGSLVVTGVKAQTDLHTADAFTKLVIKSADGTLIRLGDIATVKLDAENYDTRVSFNGKPAVYIGISATPSANPLEVIQRVNKVFPAIRQALPNNLKLTVVHDATKFIKESINEVKRTIVEASIIVILVIFLFLGSLRSVVIPIITIPLSLVGVLFFMLVMGYSVNLLTLLALVLAIGLVVDDAIVVVENVHRHIEEGMSPFDAAIMGAREIATPVIAMTITLAAVYAPIGFLGGLTGKLFTEFAFTLAGSVIISGIVALTLSPMMCAKLLRKSTDNRLSERIDRLFDAVKKYYQKLLTLSLKQRSVTVLLVFAVLVSTPCFYLMSKHQLAPEEDQGILIVFASAPQYANFDYLNKYTAQFEPIYRSFPEYSRSFQLNGLGGVQQSIGGVILTPWSERKRTQMQIQPLLQQKLNQVAGLRSFAVNLPALPGSGGGIGLKFVITSIHDYQLLQQVAEKIVHAAEKSGLFMMVDNSLQFNSPEILLTVDRNKAGLLGVSMQDIGQTLSSMLSNGYINRFSMEGRSYKVIPQNARRFRDASSWLGQFYIRTASGEMIPLSTVIKLSHRNVPNSLTQFQQLNSSTIQAVPTPGVSLGEAIGFFQEKMQRAPQGFSYDFEGQSRQFIQEGHSLLYTFLFSFIVIYLVLAAQFESFRDPLIILISVPMSIFGALIPLILGVSSVNIYTQIGLITLIGLISKHGILIVQFARQIQMRTGKSRLEAVIEASAVRLRPILMTSAAIVLGVLPLLLATGAGAVSRFDIGIVICFGMIIGTLFTLFVVPMLYTFLADKAVKDYDK